MFGLFEGFFEHGQESCASGAKKSGNFGNRGTKVLAPAVYYGTQLCAWLTWQSSVFLSRSFADKPPQMFRSLVVAACRYLYTNHVERAYSRNFISLYNSNTPSSVNWIQTSVLGFSMQVASCLKVEVARIFRFRDRPCAH